MNPEIIHDALTLLPSDLIQETDRLRNRSRKASPRWVHFTALAASLVLVVSSVMLLQLRIQKSAPTEAAQENSAMMQAAPAAPAADAAPMEPVKEVPAAEAAPEEYHDTNTSVSGHAHGFAEPEETSGTGSHAYCGNTTATIYTDDGTFSLSGSDAITITDILIHLSYDPAQTCRCTAAFTVDTETITGIEINLEKAFARCELGQAQLTKEQTAAIQEIVDNLS